MRSKKRHGFMAVLLVTVIALVLGLSGTASATNNTPQVGTQMAVCLDGSGSINPDEWSLMVGGLAAAVSNVSVVPQDGSVELTVIQFAGSLATVEVYPTVITPATIGEVTSNITGIGKRGGLTPIGAGIDLATAQITGSPNFATAGWQVINISTDGVPTYPTGDPKGAAETAVTNAVAAGIDEIDAEAIGDQTDVPWMALDLVYPDGPGGASGAVVPPDPFPPRPPDPNFMGFVRVVASFEDYAEAITQKFEVVLPPRLMLTPETDTNCVGESHTVTAVLEDGFGAPIPGETINFSVAGANPTGGSDVTDANGVATFTYTGTNAGSDTIQATDGGQTSNVVEKIWEECVPPVPGIAGWGIIAALAAMAGASMLAIRRRRAYQR